MFPGVLLILIRVTLYPAGGNPAEAWLGVLYVKLPQYLHRLDVLLPGAVAVLSPDHGHPPQRLTFPALLGRGLRSGLPNRLPGPQVSTSNPVQGAQGVARRFPEQNPQGSGVGVLAMKIKVGR